MTPMPSDCIEKMYSEMGYKEGTAEHKVLEEKAGFAYQTLLGEIMYAYMTVGLILDMLLLLYRNFQVNL